MLRGLLSFLAGRPEWCSAWTGKGNPAENFIGCWAPVPGQRADSVLAPSVSSTAKLVEPQLQRLELQKLDSWSQSSPPCGFPNCQLVNHVFALGTNYSSVVLHLGKR